MKVSDILKTKGNKIFSVSTNTTVYDALKSMSEKNIGALLVMENDQLAGIISERDYARKVILKGKASHDTSVEEIMTTKDNVITVMPEDGLEKCMELMSKHHIRHLPVEQDNKVFGMISIGDVVKSIIESQKETITHLQNYISQ
jgi:CBS domain-containing protein